MTQEDRTKLIELAKTLDTARQMANDIEATAPQTGVYGHTALALRKVLGYLTDPDRATSVYDALIRNGFTIDDVLAWDAEREEIMDLLHPNPWEQAEVIANREA